MKRGLASVQCGLTSTRRMTLQILRTILLFMFSFNGVTSYENDHYFLFQFSLWSRFDTDQCLSVSFFMELPHQKLTAGNLNWSGDRKCNDCSQWLLLSDLVFNSKVNFLSHFWKREHCGVMSGGRWAKESPSLGGAGELLLVWGGCY